MAIKISTGLGNAILDAAFNAGTQGLMNSAVLEIRSGTRPANPDTAPTGTVLGSITLPADAFGAAAAGAIAKSGTWEDVSADAAGTAAWFRIRESGDAGGASTTLRRLDGDCGTSGSDLNLNTLTFSVGLDVIISSFSIAIPIN